MKKILFILAVVLPFLLAAQNKKNSGVIMANILAGDGKPVAFAAIELRANNAAFLKRETADKTGFFQFENLPFNIYTITISATGFAKFTLDSIALREERYDFNLGDLVLKPDTAAGGLEEVIVYAEKPLVESKEGKIIYNVGESALSNGSSTAELIKTMPMVSNDPNGKILLKGKEPKILIDDKPVDLSAQQLQDLLESLPGGSVEKIELMLNPPPQYATEQGGVINIVTKKGKIGWLGKVTAMAGTRGDGNLSGNVSYRSKKLNLSGIVGSGATRTLGNNYARRQNNYKDSSNYFNTDGNYTNRNYRPNLRLQGDYALSKKHQFGFVYQGNSNIADNNSLTEYANLNRFQQVYKMSARSISTNAENYNHNFNLAYTYKTDSGSTIRVISSFNIGNTDQDKNFYQQYFKASIVQPTGQDSTQRQVTDNNSYSYNIRVDYTKPLVKNVTLLSGITWLSNRYHNVLTTTFLRKPDNVFVTKESLSNDFNFTQSVGTARLGASLQLPASIRITGGVQVERTNMAFNFLINNTAPVDNNYYNLLPNFTLLKEFSRSFNTSLAYRSTIRRPGIDELNPSINYNDPYNIRYGNPYLNPTISDNIDWNINWIKGKYYLNGSLGYNKVRDVVNSIRTLMPDGRTETTWKNISDRKEYEAGIFGGYTFNKKFRLNGSAGFTYNAYDETEKQLYKYRNGTTIFTTFNYNFVVSPLLSFDGTSRFSSIADAQGRSSSYLSLNLGAQQKLFEKRLIVTINIIDPFKSQSYRNYTYGTNFSQESYSSANTRNFRLTVAYQLNRLTKKKLTDKQKAEAINKAKAKSGS